MRRGFGSEGTIDRSGRGGLTGPKHFSVKKGTDTTVVVLDVAAAEVVRHRLYVRKNMGPNWANDLRSTCFHNDPGNPAHKAEAPRNCLSCNSALVYEKVDRKHFLYLTLIDRRKFTLDDGREFQDMKRVLELTPKQGDKFARWANAHGGLRGAVFKVYRSNSNQTDRHGDVWELVDYAHRITKQADVERGLLALFWKSPAVENLRKAAIEREGKDVTHQEVCRDLVSPYPFEEMYWKYDQADATKFVAVTERIFGKKGMGSNGTPAMPSEFDNQPDYSVPGTMATGSAPATSAAPPAAAPPAAAAPAAPDTPPWVADGPPSQPVAPPAQAAPPAAGPPAVPGPQAPAQDVPPFPPFL